MVYYGTVVLWISEPEPRWRVPYRLFDGTLLAEVEVDARTQAVLLTEEERTDLLSRSNVRLSQEQRTL